MYGHYGHSPYGQASAGAVAGGATAAATKTQAHLDPEGFMGLNWKSIMVAVTIGSLTAVLTQLTLESVRERRKSKAKQDRYLFEQSHYLERK